MTDQPRYEFTPGQNDLIGRLARKMRGVGFVYIMLGLGTVAMAGLVALAGLIDSRVGRVPPAGLWAAVGAYAVAGVVNFFLGAWTFKAGKGFIRITATRGDDIGLLMAALGELHKAYSLVFTLMVLGAVLLAAAIAVAVAGTLATPG
jgi:hypothetical protein